MSSDAIPEALLSPVDSSSKTTSALDSLTEASERAIPLNNGSANLNGGVNNQLDGSGLDEDMSPEERMTELEAELERTREERDNYAAQYRTLLSRIQTMKNTLGNKLKEDAVSFITFFYHFKL